MADRPVVHSGRHPCQWAAEPFRSQRCGRPGNTLLCGSFLFGTAFVATEPISGAKTRPGQWIYGLMIGGLTVALRSYSNFAEGMMFSVLIMNAFVPIIDQAVRQLQEKKKATP